jgi:MarR family transcriptional regulator, transcriptional regulator for hemolysin
MISDRSTSVPEDHPAWQPLGREIVFAGKEIREAFEDALARAGASLGTWIVLSALSRGGLVPQKVLASHVHIDGATMTHHIDRLEQQGLVRRRVHSGDRRVRHVEPTAKGRRLHAKLVEIAQAFDEATVAGLDERERTELRRLLAKVSANLALLEG